MNTRTIYIAAAVIIIVIITALVGWAIFIGNQQQQLQEGTQDLGYTFSGSGGVSGGGGGFFGSFLGTSEDSDEDTSNASSTTQQPEPVLQQVYNLPTAGFQVDGDSILFVDRATGHVFSRPLAGGETARIAQATIPQVYEAFFLDESTTLLMRYLDEQERIISIVKPVEGTDVTTLLPPNVREVAISPDTKRLAYLEPTSSGVSLYVGTADGEDAIPVWSSTLRAWNVAWIDDSSLLLVQKASANTTGVAVRVFLTTGTEEVLLSRISGLEAHVSPSGAFMLYSQSKDGEAPRLFLRQQETGKDTELPVRTFAQLCAWDPQTEGRVVCAAPRIFPQAQYPDDWYKGRVTFSDSFWEIVVGEDDVSTTELFSPRVSADTSLDVRKLVFDETGQVLLFINDTDQTLWMIQFPEEASVAQ